MTPPPWYLTDTAVNCFVHARRWSDSDESMRRAETTLDNMMPRAGYRARDRYGRELWRSPKGAGGLRWVIDPRPKPPDTRARVLWVGQGVPPTSVWAPVSQNKNRRSPVMNR